MVVLGWWCPFFSKIPKNRVLQHAVTTMNLDPPLNIVRILCEYTGAINGHVPLQRFCVRGVDAGGLGPSHPATLDGSESFCFGGVGEGPDMVQHHPDHTSSYRRLRSREGEVQRTVLGSYCSTVMTTRAG